jgi:hypothetical protein
LTFPHLVGGSHMRAATHGQDQDEALYALEPHETQNLLKSGH